MILITRLKGGSMMNTLIKEYCLRHALDLSTQSVVVGVSTGVDSMVLLTLLREFLRPEQIIVCHVNHGKRIASTVEEAFIREFCQKNNYRLFVEKVDGTTWTGANFQEEARLLRLEFFKDVAKKTSSRYLFLGHHLDDDIETMFLHLLRGSNLHGYAGMDEYYQVGEVAICRPLLATPKQIIIAYAHEQHITYFEDASNETDEYTRNRIRHHLIPYLYQENSQFPEKFLDYKESIQYASELLEEVRDEWIKEHVKDEEKALTFSRNPWRSLPLVMRREVLFHLLKEYRYSKAVIDEIIKQIDTEKPNLSFQINELEVRASYDLIMLQEGSNDPLSIPTITIDKIGDYKINDQLKIIVSKKRCDSQCNSRNIWYNNNMLPIVARCRREGDKIEFAYGTKKVKKILIDQKVNLSARHQAVVIEKDGTILALLGYASSIHLPNPNDCDIVIELKETKNES